MSPIDRPAAPVLGRRRLLRNSGLVVSLGALAAACGEGREGLDDPGRVGIAPEPEPLPDGDIDDIVLLRTAQSIEYTALEVYDAAVGLDALGTDATTLVERFVSDHREHADRLGELITAAGGDEYRCANEWYMDRAVAPILDAIEGTDDLARDLLHIAHAFESFAGATYQAVVGSLSDAELRRASVLIGADEVRHAATLAMAVTGTPEGYASPALSGGEAEVDDEGIPILYAIPSTFGRLTAVDLTVGPRNAEGVRFSTGLQTPAENAFVYDFLSC